MNEIIKGDYANFFIVPVEEMIKLSKLPVPPNRATTHLMIFLTSGTGSMKIGFQKVTIHKYECLVVPAGQVFSYDKHEVNKGYLCSFDNHFLVENIHSSDLLKRFEFLNIWGTPVIRPDVMRGRFLAGTFQRILSEYSSNRLTNRQILQSYLLAALSDLNAAYKSAPQGKIKTAIALTNRFKELLHRNITTNHKVTDYAAMLHVSPNHLNKTVRAATGKSTSRWIDETLVLEAKVLLAQTNSPISDIASLLGFSDQSYFSRLFKKYEGITPLAYRSMIEKS